MSTNAHFLPLTVDLTSSHYTHQALEVSTILHSVLRIIERTDGDLRFESLHVTVNKLKMRLYFNTARYGGPAVSDILRKCAEEATQVARVMGDKLDE